MVKGITTIIGMIPKGGKYAQSVVNAVHEAPKSWEQLRQAIKQIDDLLKIGKLRLDGKQKTIFESNKNILKSHEKAATEKAKYDDITKKMWKDRKEHPPFNVSKEDFTKGWTPTLMERSKARDIYKELDPPKTKYTKEMEAIDEELNELMLYRAGKYQHLNPLQKEALHDKLQDKMSELITAAGKEDLTTLSLGQINKRNQAIQKKIREIADNPNIKGTVYEGPKRDIIKAIADSERKGLDDALDIIRLKNAKKKYGTKFPRLDPDNDAFIILHLDEVGSPVKVGRWKMRSGATKHPITGELTRKEGISYWDTWDPKKNQMREVGKEVWHETTDDAGKTIMSNPDYKVTTKNMDIWNNLNLEEVNISELAKKGFKLKDIDMLVKARAAKKYVDTQEAAGVQMHERTYSSSISDIMEDLYLRGDDVYKMSIQEWTKKIPEYFAEGGQVPGFATGGVSNLFRQRYRDAGSVIKLAKGARWLIRMLKEMSDDMIFSQKQFANMTEALKMKYFKETQAAIKHLEAGGEIPENLLQSMRKDPRFQNLTVSKTGDKDFVEMQEVVLGKSTQATPGTGEKILEGTVVDESKFPQDMRKFMGKPLKTEDFVEIDLMEFKKTLPSELITKLNKLPVENQTVLLKQFKEAFDATKKGNIKSGVDILEKQLLTDFVPKGKPHATGGLIDGYATGGVSNLFRSR